MTVAQPSFLSGLTGDFYWDVSNERYPRLLPLIATARCTVTREEKPLVPGGVLNLPSTASPLTIRSTSEEDGQDGSGAQAVKICGLDQDWNPVSEVVSLRGTTGVNTCNSYRRVTSFVLTRVGRENGVNLGTIGAFRPDASLMSQIEGGESKAFSSLISTGNSRAATLVALHLLPGGQEAVTYKLFSRKSFSDGTFGPVCLEKTFDKLIQDESILFRVQPRFDTMTDLWVGAHTFGEGYARKVQVILEMILQK
jgi:hypothetical protein